MSDSTMLVRRLRQRFVDAAAAAAAAIEARDRRIAELSETANNEQRARLQADVAYMQAEARAEALSRRVAELEVKYEPR